VVEAHEGWQTADRFGRDPGPPALDFAGGWPETMVKYATNLHYYGPLFGALEPAVELQESLGRTVIEARVRALAGRLRDGLSEINGVRILSPEPAGLRSAITSFEVDGFEVRALRRDLTRQGIVTRSIDHAPFGFEAVRACTHIFNTETDVDRLVDAVRGLAASRA
jgi:selenocysteine lyase/cysteine desulfurase